MRAPATFIAVATIMLAATLSSTAGAATYYRWQDDNGVTHYGTQPPSGVESEQISVSTGEALATDKAAAPQNPARSTTENAANPRKQPRQAGSSERPPRDPATCKRAKQNLQVLKSQAVVREKDEYGKTQVLTDQQRQQKIERARKAMEYHCR